MSMDKSLQKYFSTTWLKRDRTLDQYTYSGWSLLDQIKSTEWVLDVGCGTNPFNGKIQNLYGIDITNVGCHEQVSIEEFEPAILFDVAFCLGSINFGDERTIYNQIKKINSILKHNARIYWRCNPGRHDHGNDECNNINFFPWTIEHHNKWSAEFGFNIQDVQTDNNRLYVVWERSSFFN